MKNDFQNDANNAIDESLNEKFEKDISKFMEEKEFSRVIDKCSQALSSFAREKRYIIKFLFYPISRLYAIPNSPILIFSIPINFFYQDSMEKNICSRIRSHLLNHSGIIAKYLATRAKSYSEREIFLIYFLLIIAYLR